MSFAVGQSLGPYTILAPLGAGGMGEVYRARDSRLNRDVAIKVLAPSVADSPEALARFERESHAIAALSHPNLLTIFDVGNSNGHPYAVMELLEGETLRARIAGKPLPVRKAVEIAAQIARGLAAAHDQQIAHRDLKPENVFLTPTGGVKILDFGLARDTSEHGDATGPESSTMAPATMPGTLLGTVGYMAPEQVRGEPADHRSDLFALGCVLYEMLTGQRAFKRETAAETMAAILREDPPDPSTFNVTVPPGVLRALRRCLEKRSQERFESARDLAFALESAVDSGPRIRRTTVVVAIMVAIALAAGLGVWLRGVRSGDAPARTGALTPIRLTTRSGVSTQPSLSPDGSAVAFVSDRAGRLEIYVAGLVQGSRELALTSDGGDNVQPAWSPDGRWIAYHSNKRGGIWVIPSTGGTPVQLAESGTAPAWSPDSDALAFASYEGAMVSQSTIRVARRDGSGVRDLTQVGAPIGGHRNPAWSHNGRFIAFTVTQGAPNSAIWIVEASGGEPRRLEPTSAASELRFGLEDQVLFFSGYSGDSHTLYRRPIDTRTGAAVGPSDVMLSIPGQFDGLSLARTGLLAYGLAASDTNIWTIDFDPNGEPRDPVRLTSDAVRIAKPDYSPDGRRLTFMQAGQGIEISPWVMNADGSERSQLVSGPAGSPTWGPDGSRVIVARGQSGTEATLWWVELATRKAPPLNLAKGARNPRLSPDGRELAYWMVDPNGALNTWIQSLDGGSPRRVTSDAEGVNYPVWSPDGQWLAVAIKRGSTTHVGVVSRRGGAVEQLTHATGPSAANAWSPDGEHIAFAAQRDGVGNIWEVSRCTQVSRQLTHFTSPSGYVLYPSWSPQANRIAFERQTREASIWTVRIP